MSSKYPGGFITDGAPAGYSVAFDGSGDYISAPSNAAFSFGTGDLTAECWVYFNALPASNQALFDFRNGADTSSYEFGVYSNNTPFVANSSGGILNGSYTFVIGKWYHIAFTRASGTLTIWVNGVSAGTASNSLNCTGTNCRIGAIPTGGENLNGYVSNARVLKGTALYTAAFTPPTQLFPITNTSLLTCQSPTIIDNSTNAFAITATGDAKVSNFTPFAGYTGFNPALGAAAPGVWTLSQAEYFQGNRLWPIYDPYFKNTTLLLNGNGTNGAQNNTFLDSSTNNFTITRNGNTTQGTFTPFSQTGWSNYFDGSNANLTLSDNVAFQLGSGDFTIECFYYKTASGDAALISKWNAGGPDTGAAFDLDFTSSTIRGIVASGATVTPLSVAEPSLNTWHHVAFVRGSNVLSLFVDGTRVATTSYSSTINTGSQGVGIGQITPTSFGGFKFPGYISNARIVKGTAVYNASSSTLTVPTTPLTAVSGTSLLTCQSNRFLDNSTNAFAITTSGTPSVQAFSPFAPTIAYDASTVGGSGYFDGSGDYLTAPNNAAYSLSGDFTVENWWYPTDLSASSNVWCLGDSRSANNGLLVYWSSGSGKLLVYSNGAAVITSSINTPTYAWYHIAVVRSGTTLTLYINGVSAGTATNSTSFASVAGNGFAICAEYAGTFNAGKAQYISGLRVIKGTAFYTSAFAPPLAPPTAVTNTQLLTNFTNGGIIDGTSKNVLETVGSAQISTTQSKWGGSSISVGNGNFLQSATNANYWLSSGNFTIEGWIYPTSVGTPTLQYLASVWGVSGQADNTYSSWVFRTNASNLEFVSNNGSANTTITGSGSGVVNNVWQHVAAVRNGTTLTLYLNGVSVGSGTNSTTFSNVTSLFTVGQQLPSGTNYFVGYLDDLRITKGYARYTANFTPPTSQLQQQ